MGTTIHHDICFRHVTETEVVTLRVRYHFLVAGGALQGVYHRNLKNAFMKKLHRAVDALFREGMASVPAIKEEFSDVAKNGVTIKVRGIPLHFELIVDNVRMSPNLPAVFKTKGSGGSHRQPRATRSPYTNPLRTPALQGVH